MTVEVINAIGVWIFVIVVFLGIFGAFDRRDS